MKKSELKKIIKEELIKEGWEEEQQEDFEAEVLRIITLAANVDQNKASEYGKKFFRSRKGVTQMLGRVNRLLKMWAK